MIKDDRVMCVFFFLLLLCDLVSSSVLSQKFKYIYLFKEDLQIQGNFVWGNDACFDLPNHKHLDRIWIILDCYLSKEMVCSIGFVC